MLSSVKPASAFKLFVADGTRRKNLVILVLSCFDGRYSENVRRTTHDGY